MPIVRPLLFALLPLFGGCQLFTVYTEQPLTSQPRFQGELSQSGDKLLFKSCQGKTSYLLVNEPTDAIAEQARTLMADSKQTLFADLSGTPEAFDPLVEEGRLRVTRIYRMQSEGHGCDDPNFKQLLIRAHGNEPAWNVNVSRQGLVLERLGQPSLALPYLEEQLPDGSASISTEADGLKLELWLTPQSCTDSMVDSIEHLTAELRLNDEVLHGCASYGARRSN
jgi:putative lipoprotein